MNICFISFIKSFFVILYRVLLLLLVQTFYYIKDWKLIKTKFKVYHVWQCHEKPFLQYYNKIKQTYFTLHDDIQDFRPN